MTESLAPKWSTCTEWSMTRSTGTRGLIFFGSPPRRATAERIAARSTTTGTPVKSWRITRAGLKGSSTACGAGAFHVARRRTSSSLTSKPSQLRSTASSSTRMDTGSRSMDEATPDFSRCSSR